MSPRPLTPVVVAVAIAGGLIGGTVTIATGATTPDPTTPYPTTIPATTPAVTTPAPTTPAATTPAATTPAATTPPKPSPKSPAVVTSSATSVSALGATLVGRVNPNGQATNYYFQYGTSTAYKSKTATTAIGNGTSSVTLTIPVTGLSANTKYHFRIVATNATGTSRGTDRTFTTPRALTGVTLKANPDVLTWNAKVSLTGSVGGKGLNGVKVVLMRQTFPYTTPAVQIASTNTSSSGSFAFQVGPYYAGVKFQAITQTSPARTSSILTVGNLLKTKLRVASRARTTAKLRGQIYPAVQSARVTVFRKSPKGKWVKVKRAKLSKKGVADRSRYTVTVPRYSRTTSFQVVITPRDGGAHVKTTTKTVVVSKRR